MSERFHMSLRVKDINKSVEFYGRLFGCAPVKQFADYAKFEIEHPAVVLSLEKRREDEPAALSHLGLRIENREKLVEWTSKIAERGLDFQHLDHVACCYADQSKIYMNDPDGFLVEVYMVNQDLNPERGQAVSAQPSATFDPEAQSYDHVLPAAFPQRLEYADDSLSAINLRGTLNAAIDNQQMAAIMRESFRALRPGGKLLVHMLAADREPTEAMPLLPEPASYVRRAPAEDLVWGFLKESHFVGIHAERLSPHHVFEFKGSKFRELLVHAHKPSAVSEAGAVCVYKGPFPMVTLENGEQFFRGERRLVDALTHGMVASPAYRSTFVVLNEGGLACGN